MLPITDLKLGKIIKYNDNPYIIIYSQHARTAQRRAFVRTKLRHLINGTVLEKTFNASDKFEEADIERKNASFLYKGDDGFHFMDDESYEEVVFSEEQIGDKYYYLTDGMKVMIIYFESNPVSVQLPIKARLKITETEDGVRGNTAQGNVTKPATLETGYELQVPIFIQQGEEIIINTDTGTYVERANK